MYPMDKTDELLDELERAREDIPAYIDESVCAGYRIREFPDGRQFVQIDGAWVEVDDAEEFIDNLTTL